MKALLLAAALALPPIAALSPVAALAVQPDEVLADPALELRARQISEKLRCPVCQSETIDESNAQVARDLRLLVRERLVAGDTDAQVVDYVVDRYGEYVLFEPVASGGNLILWYAGPAMLVLGLGIGFAFIRSRRRAEPPADELSEAEKARLAEILQD
ncbi:cytochrome c-type biogenesis protein [Frigidibacter sp. MR17.14]|uniref:cytochrome c-type biogenesis protein n=1 Tax=Frigidibacter sp. MR17.14 TaxID=3126509 RepID=UPI0030131A54